VPAGFTGSLFVQVFDAPYCTSASGAGDQSGSFTTTYTMRAADSPDPTQTSVLSTSTFAPASTNAAGCARWRTVHTLNNPTPGIYYLQVQASAPTTFTTSQGTNQFSIRANTSASTDNNGLIKCSSNPTTATPGSPYNARCVQVYGTEHMGVFANLAGTTPSFFLADLGPEHSGKILEITMWDMGEGTLELRLLNPLNNRVNFRWTVLCNDGDEPTAGACPGERNPAGGRSGVTDALNTSGQSLDQPGRHRLSSWRYNDRLIRLEVELPDDIPAAYGGRTWWRVQYQSCSDCSPSDRTTWSVIVRGDPVRLVP
jgi:hypothetical protein